jgi:hypothetical protein
VSRQDAGQPQSLSWREIQQVATRGVSRLINGVAGPIGQARAFRTAPEPLTRVQLGGGGGEPADLQAQGGGEGSTGYSRVGGAAVHKEHDVPAPPGLTHLAQEGLVGNRRPVLGNEELDMAGRDVQRAVDDPPGVVAGDGHLGLDTHSGPASAQRRRFKDEGFVQHEHPRPTPTLDAALEPPLAWRR